MGETTDVRKRKQAAASREWYRKTRSDPEAHAVLRAKQRAANHRRMADPEYRAHKQAKQRDWNVRKAYGISGAQLDACLLQQGYQCCVCKGAVDRMSAIDHCHDTGEVRGVLCRGCNLALWLNDDPEMLRRAIVYLENPPFRKVKND